MSRSTPASSSSPRAGAPEPPLAPRVLAIQPSGIREIVDAASKKPQAIHLEAGQPNFPVPLHIAEAAQRAISDGWNYYTPTAGIPTLRELIAAKVTRVNGFRAQASDVICTNGGTGAISAALMATLAAGDEVLLPDPAWPIYAMLCKLLGVEPTFYRCPPDNGFEPDVDALAAAITPRTRMIVINSPNNPTGAVYRQHTVEAVLDLAVRHNLWVLSDECYDQIIFDNKVVSPARLLDDGRVISVYAFSKTYSMTGWRLGYAVAAPRVMASLIKVQQSISSSISSISQKAGEAALSGPQEVIGDMVAIYRKRRDMVVDLLQEAELLMNVPAGAFYMMADVSASGLDSKQFALRLLDEREVAVSPGLALGLSMPRAVRMSLATQDDLLREGVSRLCEFARELRRDR
ncbi:MAG TPA: aminotransferase class I/II [Chloroflexi bacterium]|nr:aminotransferase class I/II [Chloroflexota bacterium]